MKRNMSKGIAWVIAFAALVMALWIPKVHAEGSKAVYPSEAETEAAEEESYFEVHFIDVGQGDSSLILCDGHAMLIDGGSRVYSSKLYAYLEEREISKLDYIAATHSDSDHVGGLAGALNYAEAEKAFCSVTEAEETAFGDFLKYLEQQNVELTVPAAGACFQLGSAKVEILAPVEIAEDDNNNSLVIRVEYGNTSFLFAGDAEEAEEQSILKRLEEQNAAAEEAESESEFQDESKENGIACTVLKAAHHGSKSSTSQAFLDAVQPEYCIVSAGENNAYGHPSDEVLCRLKEKEITLYRTDLHGTIIVTSDGETLAFQVERNEEADPYARPEVQEDEQESVPQLYILNTNSKRFHEPSCASVAAMKERNKCEMEATRQEILALDYLPCGNCHP